MKTHCLFLLIFLINHVVCQWIDPHDMNTNAKEKYLNPSTLKKSTGTSSTMNGENYLDSEVYLSHLKRFLSVLMNSAHIDKRDIAVFHGNIRFNMNPDDFDFLINFGKESSPMTMDKLRRLDTVFSESFKKAFIHDYLDEIESYQLKLYSVVVNMHNLWILGTVFLLYVVYQLFKNNFAFSYILKYLILLVLICDFGFRYQYLLEEAEEHNASIHYSTKCDPAKMTWGQWTKFWFSNQECERKTVTPLDALLYQVKNLIIIPMQAFGTGMGGFGYNLFTSLPWYLSWIMWPIMLIFVLILVVFAMVIFTGQTIEFNAFHLIKLKFGGTRTTNNENMLTGTAVERLMDRILHRPMVQNINVGVSLGDNRENPNNNGNPAIQDDSNKAQSNEKIESISNKQSEVVATNKNPKLNKSNTSEACLEDNQSKNNLVSEDNPNKKPLSSKIKFIASDIDLSENTPSSNSYVKDNSNDSATYTSKNLDNDNISDKNVFES